MKKTISILILLCSFGLTLSAQTTLTLDSCRNMAIENNRNGAIAREQSAVADYTEHSMRANFLPKFSASGQYLYSNGKIERTIKGGYLPTFVPAADGSLTPNLMGVVNGEPVFNMYAYFPDINLDLEIGSIYALAARVEQPIFMGGKIVSAHKMSRIGQQVAAANERLTREQIIVSSDEAYWNCVRAREMRRAAISYRDVVNELLRNVNNAVEAGMRSKNDVLKVQVRLNEAELNLLRAENAIKLSDMNLCYVVGLPLETAIEPCDALTDMPETAAGEQIDLSRRPEYEMLAAQKALKEQNVRLVQSDFLPQLGVAGGYGYMNGAKFNGQRLLDKASFFGVVSLSVPIFHWGEGSNKTRAAKAESNIASLQMEDGVNKMNLEVTRAYNNLTEALGEVTFCQRSLAQADDNLTDSRNRFEAGMDTVSDLLEAQALRQKAWAALIDARASVALANTQYLKSLGRL